MTLSSSFIIDKLKKSVAEVDELKQLERENSSEKKWLTATLALLKEFFGQDCVEEFTALKEEGCAISSGDRHVSTLQRAYINTLEKRKVFLETKLLILAETAQRSPGEVFRTLASKKNEVAQGQMFTASYSAWISEIENAFSQYKVKSEFIVKFNKSKPNEALKQFSEMGVGEYLKGLGDIACVLLSIAEYFEKQEENATVTHTDITSIASIELILNRFSFAVKQLRQRHDDRETIDIKDEYDVQDLLHALLKLYFDDIREEEWTPSYAGKASRVDFLLDDIGVAIEVKMTRVGLKNKEVGEQLAIDKDYYRSHAKIKHLICFIYDPEGRIKNPRGFEKDVAQDGPLKTTVYVRPV